MLSSLYRALYFFIDKTLLFIRRKTIVDCGNKNKISLISKKYFGYLLKKISIIMSTLNLINYLKLIFEHIIIIYYSVNVMGEK